MKVTTYIINEGAEDQEVILINAKEGSVLKNVPNDWKTKKAAIRWALNNGLEVVQEKEEEPEDQETRIEDQAAKIEKLNGRIIELSENFRKLEEKLQAYENAFKALKKVFTMAEEK